MAGLRNIFAKFYLQEIKRLKLPRDLIMCAVKRNGDKIAVIDREREINYRELYARSKKLANSLKNLGIKKGDKLAVLLYNCREYFEIRIAAYLTGIILVPIVWDLNLDNIKFILNNCHAKALIYHPEILGSNISHLKQETKVEYFIPVSPKQSDDCYETLVSKGKTSDPEAVLNRDDLASINFSSGTTGRPKGVILTQNSWMNSFYNFVLNSTKGKEDNLTLLHILSLATAGGVAFLPAFFLGFKNIFLEKFDTEKTVSIIINHKVNGLFLTPSLFISIFDYCKSRNIKPPLTNIVLASEAMPESKFKEAVESFGPIIRHGYGMVEILPPLTLIFSKDYMINNNRQIDSKKFLSAGKPLKGVCVKIVDKENKECQSGVTGRVIVKSATISKGYFNNPELTAKHYKGGWFYTNDFGYKDEQGYIYIMGRKEDIVKEAGGKPVFSREIEEVLHKHPDVLSACVFCQDEAKVVACVFPRANSKALSQKELSNFCKENLKERAVPDEICILPKVIVRATGKLDRSAIQKEYRGRP
ncbi:MAG: class I adenylate-forming enzyme family protein [Candidatus Omnitrophota bacterium]